MPPPNTTQPAGPWFETYYYDPKTGKSHQRPDYVWWKAYGEKPPTANPFAKSKKGATSIIVSGNFLRQVADKRPVGGGGESAPPPTEGDEPPANGAPATTSKAATVAVAVGVTAAAGLALWWATTGRKKRRRRR